MGTTFIKLGQFLATRPDIIGEELANDLEKLQDKLPPFDINLAKNIDSYEPDFELNKKIFVENINKNCLIKNNFCKIFK